MAGRKLKGGTYKTEKGTYVMCIFTGKICYTEREAGIVINGCKKHVHVGGGKFIKSAHGKSKAIPRRKHYCKDCGFYHVTHLALYDFDSQNYAWEDNFYREYERNQKSVCA